MSHAIPNVRTVLNITHRAITRRLRIKRQKVREKISPALF
jgi:hypothetical protein